ncbi:flocculation protein FLO11 [Mastacembelus armatus]|uniref:flocculation protein FLO11 n=1 Tax=Mastacembelus armatus TaxID=205130 RepID=UPI000E4637FF|nr:flocculation protein FLO11-like [Mastacembelus armatus]
MSPLSMESDYEPNSPGSLSATGSEREERQQTGNTVRHRREKNRDAARKSRKKQTERADELHEELQRLEQSNSAFQKEIATLKKDLHRYTTALERHEPYCCLRTSTPSSSSSTPVSVSPSADCQTSSSPLRVSPQASSFTSAASPAPMIPTLSSSSGLSSELFVASSPSPMTAPYSQSFSTLPAPHSLFSDESLITSSPTNVTPVCTSLFSNPPTSLDLTTAAQPQSVRDTVSETSLVEANACSSLLHFDTIDALLIKPTSFTTDSSNSMPSFPADVAGYSTNMPQLHAGHFSRKPHTSGLSTLQGPDLQCMSASPPSNLEASPAPAFPLQPSYSQLMTPKPASWLSLLTVPSPLDISQTTSNSFDGLMPQPPPPLPLLGDPSRDPTLSDLLEFNDWILSGTCNQ